MRQPIRRPLLALYRRIRKRRNPVSFHRENVCHPGEFLDHTKNEHQSEEGALEGGVLGREDKEPYYAGGQYHEFVGIDSEEEGAEAGRRVVDPAAESRGEEEDADGFGDATADVSKETFDGVSHRRLLT